jgi:hypothetical protein
VVGQFRVADHGVVERLDSATVQAHIVRAPAGTERLAAGGELADQLGELLNAGGRSIRAQSRYDGSRGRFLPYAGAPLFGLGAPERASGSRQAANGTNRGRQTPRAARSGRCGAVHRRPRLGETLLAALRSTPARSRPASGAGAIRPGRRRGSTGDLPVPAIANAPTARPETLPALRKAVDSGRPCLVEVRCHPHARPPITGWDGTAEPT